MNDTDPVVEIRPPARRPIRVVLGDRLDLGRECDGLVLVDPGVSRRHARLELDGGQVWVQDLGSKNGTLLNGAVVTDPVPLGPGDLVVLGRTEVRLVEGVGAPTTGHPPDSGDPRATVAGVSRDHLVAATPEPAGRDGGDGDTITIVFSDIESSTEQALALGDGRWFDLLAIHSGIVRTNLARHGGREIKDQGDGFMLTFTSARRALNFAIDVQQALARWSAQHPDEALRVRIGMHTGEAMVAGTGDLFGKHVIIAARIAALARGGEILASNLVVEITSNRSDLDFGQGRPVTLKGVSGTYTVHALAWD